MTAYPTARIVSKRIREHLLKNASTSTDKAASLPTPEIIEAMVEAGFWASLRLEEGRTPLLSLAYVSAEQVKHPLLLERPVRLAPEPLTKVAPAVERPGIHLGVWEDQGELRVWGATRALPRRCFVIEVVAPGSVIVKQSPSEDAGKFVNIAILQGDEIKVVDQKAARASDCPEFLSSLLGFESQHAAADPVLIQLAVSMRAHGRGGTLLVVPPDSETWRESIVHPIMYSVTPNFSALSDLLNADGTSRAERWWQDALRRAVDAVAGLTGVDGATVVTSRYELVAFGAKIMRRLKYAQATRVITTEPIEDSEPEELEPADLGGTRHMSAVQFTQDQKDAIALVASQDGRFTVFAWSPHHQMVRAHRIETLLL